MKARLFHQVSRDTTYDNEAINPRYFNCLKQKDVITAKVSDHHPIIHDGILFWNIMMQGKYRSRQTGASYNNGLALIETDEDYIHRLIKVADVIAEITSMHPFIDVINICEGPILPLHIETLTNALKKYHSMHTFFTNSVGKNVFHQPNVQGFPNWGLLMLADKKYNVTEMKSDFLNHDVLLNKLANRFQIWQLTNDRGKSKYMGLGHFPFGGDEYITEKYHLSAHGKMYCHFVRNVLKDYSDEEFILSADFNLNPYLISEWNDRAMDMIANHNSILLTTEKKSDEKVAAVTVDGVLLSRLEKQRYYSSRFNVGLFHKLTKEDSFAQSSIHDHLIQNRHQNAHSQKAYDSLFGLVIR